MRQHRVHGRSLSEEHDPLGSEEGSRYQSDRLK